MQGFQKTSPISSPQRVRLGPHNDGPSCTARPAHLNYCDATRNSFLVLTQFLKSPNFQWALDNGADSMVHGGHVPFTHFYKWLGTGGTVSRRTANKTTDQSVLTITKALTKTTNCTFRAQKWRGTTTFRSGPVPPPPTFKFVPAPLTLEPSYRKGKESGLVYSAYRQYLDH